MFWYLIYRFCLPSYYGIIKVLLNKNIQNSKQPDVIKEKPSKLSRTSEKEEESDDINDNNGEELKNIDNEENEDNIKDDELKSENSKNVNNSSMGLLTSLSLSFNNLFIQVNYTIFFLKSQVTIWWQSARAISCR